MDFYLVEWISLGLRWLHVVAGAAWIGTSFYFNALNQRLRPPSEPRRGVAGELWAVHGGGLFRVEGYGADPGEFPETLHWFKWEAYVTWLSGFSLLVVVYYLGSVALLVDPATSPVSHETAIGISVGVLLLGWLVYDALCRSRLAESPRALAALGFALGTAAAWGLAQVLSPRAAYIHVGAMLGTLMAGNVFRVIIPQQRRMVCALAAGRGLDPDPGRAAARRSLHNNYLTLPVILIMVSQHYPMTYGHSSGWAILATLSLIGAGVRHYFNLRARSRSRWWLIPLLLLGIALLVWLGRPQLPAPAEATSRPVPFTQVREIIERRCASCHAARPSGVAFSYAPLGVLLETPRQIHALAWGIGSFAVASHTMPMGNLTGMSPEERAVLRQWIREGARIEE